MMDRCREVEPLFAPYVDGDAAPADRASVDAHLQACPPCRARVAGERAVRDVVRAKAAGLRGCAPDDLRSRCAALGAAPASRGSWRRAWVPLSMAAVLVLAAAGVFVWGLGDGVQAYATQLAVDHKKCFQFAPAPSAATADTMGADWRATQGWPLRIPASLQLHDLQLLGVRRCLSSEGRVAHVMYRWHGQPLSIYVVNSRVESVPDAAGRFASVDRLGEQAVMWTRGDRTYAVVGRAEPGLMEVVRYVQRTVE
jgi:anti-sigma factor RsiW